MLRVAPQGPVLSPSAALDHQFGRRIQPNAYATRTNYLPVLGPSEGPPAGRDDSCFSFHDLTKALGLDRAKRAFANRVEDFVDLLAGILLDLLIQVIERYTETPGYSTSHRALTDPHEPDDEEPGPVDNALGHATAWSKVSQNSGKETLAALFPLIWHAPSTPSDATPHAIAMR